MPKLIWAICCERPIVNEQTNNLSAVEIIEEILVPEIPINIPHQFFVVTLWQKETNYGTETEHFKFRTPLKSPKGKKLESKTEVEVVIDKDRLRAFGGFYGMPVKQEGVHKILIELWANDKWRKVGEVSINIKKSIIA